MGEPAHVPGPDPDPALRLRYLICDTCKRPALATPEGILHTAAFISMSKISILCRRCGRNTTITRADFLRTPILTPAEIAHSSCDIKP